jgi:hypothetical protein
MALELNKQKHSVLIINENRQITRGKIKIMSRFLQLSNEFMAWLLLREYCAHVKGFKRYFFPDNSVYSILDTRSAVPLSPYSMIDEKTLEGLKDSDKIAEASFDHVEAISDAENKKMFASDMMAIAIMALVAGVVIIGIIIARRGGG